MVALLGAEAQGQTRMFRDVRLGTGLHFQRWTLEGGEDASELSVPLIFVWPVNKRLAIDVVTGGGSASLSGPGESLSGLTDTKIRANYVLGEEAGLITLGISTPTGQTELDTDQQIVSQRVAESALNFRTTNFGQGLDINVGVAIARKLGETVFGLGAGYLLKGEFTPRAAAADYKPGSELNLTLGLDRKIMDGDGTLTFDVIATTYGDDEQGGQKVFKSASKVVAQLTGRFSGKGLDWMVYAVERTKGKNTSYAGPASTKLSTGNQIETGLSVTRTMSQALAVRGVVDLKVYGDNAGDVGEASVSTIGPGIKYTLSPGRTLDFNLRFGSGEIDSRQRYTCVGQNLA